VRGLGDSFADWVHPDVPRDILGCAGFAQNVIEVLELPESAVCLGIEIMGRLLLEHVDEFQKIAAVLSSFGEYVHVV